jgi:hypothetical protein
MGAVEDGNKTDVGIVSWRSISSDEVFGEVFSGEMAVRCGLVQNHVGTKLKSKLPHCQRIVKVSY